MAHGPLVYMSTFLPNLRLMRPFSLRIITYFLIVIHGGFFFQSTHGIASFAYKAGKKTNLKLVIMSDSPMSEVYFPVNMMKDGWARYSAFLGRIYVLVYACL